MNQAKEEKRKNEVALVEQFKKGNQLAFRELYDYYNPMVRSIVYGFYSLHNDCDDICQETWLQIIRKINKFSGGYFASWVKRLTINCCMDAYRKNHRKRVINIIYDTRLFDIHDLEDSPNPPKVSEKMYESGFRYFDRLNDLEQKIITLMLKGFKLIRIADIVKKPYGTCLPAFSAAIVKLRRGLVEDGTITKKGLSLNLRKVK